MFVGQLESRRRTEFRARETGDIPIASGGAASAAKPLVNEKNDQSPDVRSGRQKVLCQYIASLSVTPTCVGVPVSFWVVRVVPPATLPRVALHHSLWVCRPDGLKIPRAFSPPNSNLSITTNTDNTSIFNCRSNKAMSAGVPCTDGAHCHAPPAGRAHTIAAESISLQPGIIFTEIDS